MGFLALRSVFWGLGGPHRQEEEELGLPVRPLEMSRGDYTAGRLAPQRQIDVAADGRLLMMRREQPGGYTEAQVVLAQNWAEELKRLVPVP